MAEQFGQNKTLPPGSFVPDIEEKALLSSPIHFIYVGSATYDYGTYLTLDAFKIVNREHVLAKLTYICPREQWERLGIDTDLYKPWLDVVHTSGDDTLKKYYENADIAILTAPRSFYRDFAVPIKIFEYISYLKPILVTNCTETARIVIENRCGWVVEDNAESVADQILALTGNTDEIYSIKKRMHSTREHNLWQTRALKVIDDLNEVSPSC